MAYRDWTPADKQEFDAGISEEIYSNIAAALPEAQSDAAREAFELGWLTWPTSQEEAENYREQFYELSGMTDNLFRALGYWQVYRELYDSIDYG